MCIRDRDLCDEIVVLNKGVLKPIEPDRKSEKAFKEKIMASLMEE